MPPAATELAVGHGVQAHGLLLLDDLGDLGVFDLAKLFEGDLSGGVLGTRVVDCLRAEETADDVIAEGRVELCHDGSFELWVRCEEVTLRLLRGASPHGRPGEGGHEAKYYRAVGHPEESIADMAA